MVAFAGHPLLIEGRLVGVIGLFFRHRLTNASSRIIAAIADEVALGIERLRSEERLRRSNRALKILSRCNEALVHAGSEAELLDKICEIITGPEGYRMAWVGFAETGAMKIVRPVAQAGFEEGYLRAIKVTWDDSPTGRGPAGAAIRTGKISVMKDVRADPNFAPWRAEAMQRGYSSLVGLPLIDAAAKPIGALTIYSSEADAFDEEEIRLLAELAANLSFGIISFRLREEHDHDLQEKQELQGQLRQAQKLEAIGTLAGGIAHDFNNILSAILGYAQLAQEETRRCGKASADIDQVINAGKRAADLVRQILTISRQTEQVRHPVKVQYIVKEALKLLRPSIPMSIDIRSDINAGCPEILGDPTEIHQVLMNLCTNAYHAMRDKGGTMKIALRPVTLDKPAILAEAMVLEPGGYIQLTVRDTGCGMDAATMEKIFDPYFTTKKKGEGTGLGLAVVYGIVTGYGGAISVASEPGQGSTFQVYLPIREALPHGKEKTVDPLPLSHGTERIMVIDDEEPIAQLLRRALANLGYQVAAFTSCTDALQSFATKPESFDLVITDLYMPKITGIDLAQTLLQIRPDTPIILCTGFSEKVDREYAKVIGIREFVYKPVDMNDMSRLVRNVLDGAGEGK